MESKQDIYVTGHRNPDTDSVACAIAYAYLLRQTGVNATAASSGPVNQETQFVLDYFNIPAPVIIDHAEGKKFILVDHSSYAQAMKGMDQAEVIGIIDHHQIGDVEVVNQGNIIDAPAGAASTLVFLQYQTHGVVIPRDMAGIMLAGILSDTRNMKRNVTKEDQDAYEKLVEIAQIKDIDAFYRNMSGAIASYGNLCDKDIFFSDYKKYETDGKTFCISVVNAVNEEQCRELGDRMYAVLIEEFENLKTDMGFIIINNLSDDEKENKMYMMAYGNHAEEFLNGIFHNYDGERYFVFAENLSRKTTIVPAIMKVCRHT
ncbi:MAG: DHH family phosphoesterase [Solobacterium sp.]|nr:DHH family phosphoesterase [Solobacterium sp.]